MRKSRSRSAWCGSRPESAALRSRESSRRSVALSRVSELFRGFEADRLVVLHCVEAGEVAAAAFVGELAALFGDGFARSDGDDEQAQFVEFGDLLHFRKQEGERLDGNVLGFGRRERGQRMTRCDEGGGIKTPEGFVPGFLIPALEGGEQFAIGPHGVRCSPTAGGRQAAECSASLGCRLGERFSLLVCFGNGGNLFLGDIRLLLARLAFLNHRMRSFEKQQQAAGQGRDRNQFPFFGSILIEMRLKISGRGRDAGNFVFPSHVRNYL